jgi:hypothetical protein
MPITITIDINVMIKPDVWKENMTAAMAPGPAKSGKANGITPESSDISPPNL